MDSKNIPIVFLHGLGSTPITMWPLKEYIKRWNDTYIITACRSPNIGMTGPEILTARQLSDNYISN